MLVCILLIISYGVISHMSLLNGDIWAEIYQKGFDIVDGYMYLSDKNINACSCIYTEGISLYLILVAMMLALAMLLFMIFNGSCRSNAFDVLVYRNDDKLSQNDYDLLIANYLGENANLLKKNKNM